MFGFQSLFKKGSTRLSFFSSALSLSAEVTGVLRERDLEQDSPVERIYQRLVKDWIN